MRILKTLLNRENILDVDRSEKVMLIGVEERRKSAHQIKRTNSRVATEKEESRGFSENYSNCSS